MCRKCPRGAVLHGIAVAALLTVFLAGGCDRENGTTRHQKAIGAFTEEEYHIPKLPVDRHYIGYAWSKQFGPVKDPLADEVRVKKERSFNEVQQDFAYNVGIQLRAQSVAGPGGEVDFQRSAADRSKLEGVEIITPVSLADIPFAPEVPYVIEALRLKGFTVKSDTAADVGVELSASKPLLGGARMSAGGGTASRTKTGGEGLVVAYKLSKIDIKTYAKQESDTLRLALGKPLDFPEAGVVVTARLRVIEPGADRPHPPDILWPCDRAQAESRDIVAAWTVDVVPMHPKKKRLSIGFPAYPEIEDCNYFSGVIFSKIDPRTDKIHRQKITVTVVDAEVSDTLQPMAWDARVSLVNESFNIKPLLAQEGED